MSKVVVVTGASTGIGYDAVRALIEKGFHVVATVRKKEDKIRLEEDFKIKITVILLDVTDFQQVDNFAKTLHEHGLYDVHALINNAGVAMAAPFLDEDFQEIENIMKVNVLSVMRLTQVLIPCMKENSRIVNISSVAGKVGTPFLAVYAASKHAIEGFSEALRKEMRLLKIKVIVVAPGSIQTPIWQKGFTQIKEKYNSSQFAVPFKIFMKIADSSLRSALPVSAVSECIVKAVDDANPAYRYAPIPKKFENWYLPLILPQRIFNYLTAKTLKLDP
jgi:short-subunit dehydrogenase